MQVGPYEAPPHRQDEEGPGLIHPADRLADRIVRARLDQEADSTSRGRIFDVGVITLRGEDDRPYPLSRDGLEHVSDYLEAVEQRHGDAH
jgi:hypothetical protein